MNSNLHKGSAFSETGFFYRNLHIQEVFSTIRYGIEARKGLIILTGEAGTGKTMLLQKVAAEMPANVTCIVEPDPRLDFAEILRLILRNLKCEISDQDEPAMLRTCKLQLRARAERCEMVSLILDNAHHLPDSTLRYITHNFTGGSAEDPSGSLLQLVLSGRPGLTTKLSRAALVPLRRTRAIVCHLHPLSNREIAAFIQQGLGSNNHPAELFDERAIKRVALYAQGNPRLVKALCDRAMQLAGTLDSITPELIEGAAADLDLHASRIPDDRGDGGKSKKADARDHSAPFQFHDDDFHADDFIEAGRATFKAPHVAEIKKAAGSRRRTAAWARNIMIAVVVVAGAALIRSEVVDSTVSWDWGAKLKQLAAQLQPPSPSIKAKPETPVENILKEEPPIRVPGPDFPAVSPDDNDTGLAGAPNFSNDAEAPSGARLDDASPVPARIARENGAKANQERRPLLKSRSDPEPESLQSQVARAIESRAIMGVEVSVIHGTAYLDGRVATERQRRAAERAARSVAGVERVQNRIAISYG